ncbi:hypothetical protein GN316_06495 [Xylophilus sp. Kf1]|nr:hypothetical protein [Xylophilus sp. Kf1]
MTNDLALAPRQQFDLSPQSFEQAITFSNYLAESDLVPKDFKGKPGNCLIAMQWGSELGLKPLQALQNLAIINGRPSLWGDAVIALVRGSPLCESVIETDDGHTATCVVKRRGEPQQSRTFSMDDAKAAGLVGKQGPWSQYPKRMRQMRARAFALRDVFPDVLRGLPVAEEIMDIPGEPRHMGQAEVVSAPPPPAPSTWPDDAFQKRLPNWQKAIDSGKAADEIISFAETKGLLSDQQKATIRALKPTAVATTKVTFAQVSDGIRLATNLDQLAEAAELIGEVPDAEQRAELTAQHEARQFDLT